MLIGKLLINILSDYMNMKQKQKCEECEHFIAIDKEGKCDIYDSPNHEISFCIDWTRRGQGRFI